MRHTQLVVIGTLVAQQLELLYEMAELQRVQQPEYQWVAGSHSTT
jgi:hypothetical protein